MTALVRTPQKQHVTTTTSLSQAFRYAFQGRGWRRRMLTLALVQLIPIVGQSILLGYGMEVVRSVYAGQTGLPPIRWRQALSDGLRLFIAGLLYVVPLLAIIPMVLTIGTSQANTGGGANFIGLLVTLLLAMILLPIIRRLRQQGNTPRYVLLGLSSITPIVAVVSTILTFAATQPNFSLETTGLTPIGLTLLILLGVLAFVSLIGLHIGGMRYAIEGRGIFDPNGNVRLMLQNRDLTRRLILNFIGLILIASVTIAVGLVLLILPGLFMLVTCSLAWWYTLARYSIDMGVGKPA